MIKLFIVHSGSEYQHVKNYIEPFLEGKIEENGRLKSETGPSNVSILTLDNKKTVWKPEAKKKIREAQIVLFVMGQDPNLEAKTATIGWEIRQACKLNKIILLYRSDPTQPIPAYFFRKDSFTAQEHPIAQPATLAQIRETIRKYDEGEYNLFSPWFRNMTEEERTRHRGELFEQYKLYQQTSEELVKRRQSVNSFYQALNGLLLPMVIAVLGTLKAELRFTELFSIFKFCTAAMILAGAGFALDFSWITLLNSYGKLNSAKMTVLGLMEQQLPMEIYKVEWDVQSDRLQNKTYQSFTTTEKRIPKLFCLGYGCMFCISMGFLMVCWAASWL